MFSGEGEIPIFIPTFIKSVNWGRLCINLYVKNIQNSYWWGNQTLFILLPLCKLVSSSGGEQSALDSCAGPQKRYGVNNQICHACENSKNIHLRFTVQRDFLVVIQSQKRIYLNCKYFPWNLSNCNPFLYLIYCTLLCGWYTVYRRSLIHLEFACILWALLVIDFEVHLFCNNFIEDSNVGPTINEILFKTFKNINILH